MLETIYIGDMVSIELAKLNGVDPTPVEVIENLKSELAVNSEFRRIIY